MTRLIQLTDNATKYAVWINPLHVQLVTPGHEGTTTVHFNHASAVSFVIVEERPLSVVAAINAELSAD